ncbi:MAG: thioredoxin family protein [Candidatus Sumerlaeaceae bacterium]
MNRIFLRSTSALLLAGIHFITVPLFAQYEVQQWANFEDKKIPADAMTIGKSPDQTLKVVDLSAVQGAAPAFRVGAAGKETGKAALEIQTMVDAPQGVYSIGLAMKKELDRDTLGPQGRALLQADFYIPETGKPLPSLAVLAMDLPTSPGIPIPNNIPAMNRGFYRFGITKQASLYFSCVRPSEATAAIYLQDNELLKQIPSPGWHRFALAFQGPDTIHCYIDGREPKFSPIKDTSFKKMLVGVMLAENKLDYKAYMDNLSIQVSKEAPGIPDSPYAEGWNLAASATGKIATDATAPAPLQMQQVTGWVDPLEAWQTAQKLKKPMLLYFYAPGVKAVTRMDNLFATDPDAKEFLARHACARIDVNQLQGGDLAKKYEVFKVPTLLVFSPDAKQAKKSSPTSNADFKSVVTELALKP